MDLGLTPVLMPALEWINGIVQNYGITDIIFTIFIKLLTLPLDLKQRKTSRRMSAIQPKIAKLQQKYANDKDKLGQKMVELYRQEGVSPFSGCLPLLISLPILMIMLGVLRNYGDQMMLNMYHYIEEGNFEAFSTLMNQSKFLWIQNVWQPDSLFGASNTILPSAETFARLLGTTEPEQIQAISDVLLSGTGQMGELLASYETQMNGLFILPIIAGGTQFIQAKFLMPQMPSTDSSSKGSSAMMLYFMPIMSIWICSSSTSAFSLYWVFSNLFSMTQMLITNKIYDGKFIVRQTKGG